MKSKRIIIIIAVIVFIPVLLFTYSQIYKYNSKKAKEQQNEVEIEETTNTEEKNFDEIFESKLNNKEYVNKNITKIVAQQPYVYSIIEKKELVENKYNIDVKIPLVNINNEVAQNFNTTTQKIFVDKLNQIIEQEGNNTIYKVEYMSYINEDTLSVIIKATLKEGNSSQRVMVQTYNIDLQTLQEVKLTELLEKRSINKEDVKNKIIEKIDNENQESVALKELGYEIFTRDPNSEYYDVEKIDNFYIDAENKINIVFAYGNEKFTSELDVVKID